MEMFSPFLIPVVAIIGVFTYSIVRSLAAARIRELEVRERIAMIERGLVPPPEKDPQGFDRAMNRYERVRDRYEDMEDWYPRHRAPGRFRTAGVTLMGVGFGLMLMISVAGGAPEAGVGVGGFLVVMGLAFFVNSWMSRNELRMPPRGDVSAPMPPPRSTPPPASEAPTDSQRLP